MSHARSWKHARRVLLCKQPAAREACSRVRPGPPGGPALTKPPRPRGVCPLRSPRHSAVKRCWSSYEFLLRGSQCDCGGSDGGRLKRSGLLKRSVKVGKKLQLRAAAAKGDSRPARESDDYDAPSRTAAEPARSSQVGFPPPRLRGVMRPGSCGPAIRCGRLCLSARYGRIRRPALAAVASRRRAGRVSGAAVRKESQVQPCGGSDPARAAVYTAKEGPKIVKEHFQYVGLH